MNNSGITGTSKEDQETEYSGPRKGPKKILIIGSGFGGAYALRRMLPSISRKENIKVTMVSDENFFLFTPVLHMVAMGSIETRHIAYPIRRIHKKDQFEFIQSKIERIKLGKRQIITSHGILDYDYLLLALGSVTHMPDFEIKEKSADSFFTLKTLTDTVLIRNHIIDIFERASVEVDPEKQRQLLTFVVAGAGYTGIQLITELRDFIRQSLMRFYKNLDPAQIRIILIETEHKIMAGSREKLSSYISRYLEHVGIEVRLNSRITCILNCQAEINKQELINTETIIWVAGVVSNPKIAEIDAAKDDIGRVLVDDYLEVKDFKGVYAVGDCAHFLDRDTGKPIPPRAHTTVRQAKVAADNIVNEIRGKRRRPYHFSNPFDTVSLGMLNAVFRYHDLYLYGLLGRFIWVSGYLLLSPGLYNRARILGDWMLTAIFGPDITNVRLRK